MYFKKLKVFSLIMRNSIAIKLKNVTKAYMLYGSNSDQFISIMKLTRFGFRVKQPPKEFIALNDISIEITHGQRVGVIGRNGSGKTTFLKLIGQNYLPTTGSVNINGEIRSLMTSGLGFHPEYTGRENIHASLKYNDLSPKKYDKAVDEIITFCELGEFIDQPFKAYSLGMQSRLQFACATAIDPDILIVDEVLGAGDVYFSVKSASRMERLTQSGATLVLVSHSMQQVLQYCERVIWIDGGKIIQDGEAMEVVKQYEEFMFNLSKKLTAPVKAPKEGLKKRNEIKTELMPDWFCKSLVEKYTGTTKEKKKADSRWINDSRLSILSFKLVGADKKETQTFESKKALSVNITIKANETDVYNCWYVVLIYSKDSQSLIRAMSPKNIYSFKKNEEAHAEVLFNELLLNTGEYHMSIGIFKNWDTSKRSDTNWYEILNRSVIFKVVNKEHNPGIFLHPHKWIIPTNKNKIKK